MESVIEVRFFRSGTQVDPRVWTVNRISLNFGWSDLSLDDIFGWVGDIYSLAKDIFGEQWSNVVKDVQKAYNDVFGGKNRQGKINNELTLLGPGVLPANLPVDEARVTFRAWSQDDLTASFGRVDPAGQVVDLGERRFNQGDNHFYEHSFSIPLRNIPPNPYFFSFGSGDSGTIFDVGVASILTVEIAAQQHIFYRGTDGAINHIWWDAPTGFHHDRWTDAASAPAAAGNPATMLTPPQQHIFYRGTDGAINHIRWDNGWQFDSWTQQAGAPPAAGNPVTMVVPDQQHVFYRGTDGAINHIWWDVSTGFHHDSWAQQAGAPPAAGDPVTMLTPPQQHVFYRGTDGAINHIWWDVSTGFHHDRWTDAASAPAAAGNPATMLTL